MNRLILSLCASLFGVLGSCQASAYSPPPPQTIGFDYEDVQKIRLSLLDGKSTYRPAFERLVEAADLLLAKVPATVTDGDTPPTGDPHDFYAIGKFSWPNPDTPNGMPYIRGDGRYNEEAFGPRYDLVRFQDTVGDINTLVLAWHYTRDEKYAAKAAELLKTWFIDPATRMNPNMNCASALPGVHDGMAVGIIFTAILIEMTDHVRILRLSKSWDRGSDAALRAWFSEYRSWLRTSRFGLEEREATNNHGTWYSAQIVAYSLLIGDRDGISEEFERAKGKVATQIMPDGQLPREQDRVEGFHYFLYGLKAFNSLASGLDRFGYDLWSYRTADGRSIAGPYRYIMPYVVKDKFWAGSGKMEISSGEVIRMIDQAAGEYALPDSKRAEKLLRAGMAEDDINRLYVR